MCRKKIPLKQFDGPRGRDQYPVEPVVTSTGIVSQCGYIVYSTVVYVVVFSVGCCSVCVCVCVCVCMCVKTGGIERHEKVYYCQPCLPYIKPQPFSI